MTVFGNVHRDEVERLTQFGFQKEQAKSLYEELRLTKKGTILILYTSGKLLLQGKAESVEQVAKELHKLKIGERAQQEHFRQESGWITGSDESLKGDTFGGLVVAAVKADNALRQKLQELGAQDSKELSDAEIIPLAEKIRSIAPCEVRSILPEEYNKHHGGITSLLNKLHGECARDLASGKSSKHVVDKYPGCAVGDVQEEKAESKYVEVAAASILARAAALQQLDFLSTDAGFPLPKGSTHVQGALQRLKEKGVNMSRFVKIDFRNVKEFL